MQLHPDDSLAEQFEERRRAFEQNMIGFLQTELELAKTFTEIAKTDRAEKAANHLSNARKAYDTVLYFLGKIRLSENEKREFAVNLGALKADLEKLGETFPARES